MLVDLCLLLLFAAMALWAAKRGFFVTVLQLAAWLVSLAVSRALSQGLAPPLYQAFAAAPARRMIESNLDGAVNGSQAAQYAGQVLRDLPDALSQLAARLGGVTPEGLLEGLDAQQLTTANAAAVLEQSIVAPIGVAVLRAALGFALFVLLLFGCRLLARKLAMLRRLPVLKQADRLLGLALGLMKGALLLFLLALVLQAAAALSPEGSALAEAVDSSRIVALFS